MVPKRQREVLSTKRKALSLVQDKNNSRKISLKVKGKKAQAPSLKSDQGAVELRKLMSEEDAVRVIASWLMDIAGQIQEGETSDKSPGASDSTDHKVLSGEG